MHESSLPTIFDMAVDYLPIQASSVPSERVFSSSGETDTPKRNRISPVLMEALQLLKFGLKKARLDFMDGWVTSEKLMNEPEEVEADLLAGILGDDGGAAFDAFLTF
jgi:hypothetical protein